jgi:hypothetical protein
MIVYLPKVQQNGLYNPIQSIKESDVSALANYSDLALMFENRKAYLDEVTHQHVINFSQNIKVASVKNFQLVENEKHNNPYNDAGNTR